MGLSFSRPGGPALGELPTRGEAAPRKSFYWVLAAFGVLAVGAIARRRRVAGGAKRKRRLAAWGLEPNTTLRQHHLNPLEQLNLYLDGFHFQNGELARQIRACHYCAILSEDLIQCALFDRPDREARLIGIEYIISERLFQSLPAEEKLLWHSHGYEVASGQMTAPGLSGWAELQLADKLKTTYGKAWLTWESAEPQSLPLGIPKLMMAFTEDGQIRPELLAERDRLLNLSTARNRQERLHLNVPVAADGANAWEKGEVGQLELVRIGMSFGSRE